VTGGGIRDGVVVVGGDGAAHPDRPDHTVVRHERNAALAEDELVPAERGHVVGEEHALGKALLEIERGGAEAGGRVRLGARDLGRDPEGAVHALLPLIGRFRTHHPEIQVDVRRVPSRQVGVEVAQGSLDFGVVTFQPAERGLLTLNLGPDDLVMLVHPQHVLAGRKEVSMAEFGRETVIAHNDPSPARERVLRTFELKHAPINIQVALPSLEAIKRAVEMKMGVALLPRRCALSELSRGQLAAVKIPQVRLARQLRLVYRRAGELSHAAQAFLAIAKHQHPES